MCQARQELVQRLAAEHEASLQAVVGVKEQEQVAVLDGALAAQRDELVVRSRGRERTNKPTPSLNI